VVEAYRLSEFDRQIQAIEKGFKAVIPYQVFKLSTWKELERR
jgi:hypothetical protein